jgi:PDZ domain-containing secreted protein
MKFNVLAEAMLTIKDLGLEGQSFTMSQKVYEDKKESKRYDVVTIEVKFNPELMNKLSAISNHTSFFPSVDGKERYLGFNIVRGSEGDRLDFHLV